MRSKSSISAPASVGRPAIRNASKRADRALAFRERRPNAVRTIAEGSHHAQTGYDHSAFGTKHEGLVELRRGRSHSSSRAAPSPFEALHYYCFEGQGRRHKLDATLKFFADILDIHSIRTGTSGPVFLPS